MSADDVRADAEKLVDIFPTNPSKNELVVRLQIPSSTLLSAVDQLRRRELALLQKRVGERLM
jgi:hypothetical protein